MAKHSTSERVERVHLPTLRYIIDHAEELRMEKATAVMARSVLSACVADGECGVHKVKHTTYRGFGRMRVGRLTACKNIGLQSLWGQIHNAISGRYYHDIDRLSSCPRR